MFPFKNKNYFTFDNLSKYGHITLKFVGSYFIWVVTIFSKKKGYFNTKIGGRKKVFKKKKKKVLWPLSPRVGGGGKALRTRPLREELFFVRFPLPTYLIILGEKS